MRAPLKTFIDKYGSAIGVVTALVLLVVLMPNPDATTGAGSGNGGDSIQPGLPSEAASTPPDASAQAGAPTALPQAVAPRGAMQSGGATTGLGTGTPGQTRGAGASGQAWGPGQYPRPGASTVCRSDGRMPDFSFYSPVCVPAFRSDNGGATSMGVSRREILVVRYAKQVDPATQAALEGAKLADTPAVSARQREVFARYFSLHYETYGRRIKVVDFKGTGSPTDETVLRADAVQIAAMKPFAVFDPVGNAGLIPFAEELAARKIICLCVNFTGRGFFRKAAPYNFSLWPNFEQAYDVSADYIVKQLAGKPAKWAGSSVGIDNARRRFGLVYVEGQGQILDPYAKQAKDHYVGKLRQGGVRLERSVGYAFDASTAPSQATNIIAQLKTAKVNHVVYAGDPVMLVFLTQEATRQTYFPEWEITGLLTVDTTLFGRTLDQQQWRHAFGFSGIPVLYDDYRTSPAYVTFQHGCGCNDGDEGNSYAPMFNVLQFIALGLHYAGPHLTPETFAAGLIAAPAKSGGPKIWRWDVNAPDYTAMSDFVEVWWNPTGRGKDEIGNDGVGRIEKSNSGRRYLPGGLRVGNALVFGDDPHPTWRSTDRDTYSHGDRHSASQPCRSCSG